MSSNLTASTKIDNRLLMVIRKNLRQRSFVVSNLPARALCLGVAQLGQSAGFGSRRPEGISEVRILSLRHSAFADNFNSSSTAEPGDCTSEVKARILPVDAERCPSPYNDWVAWASAGRFLVPGLNKVVELDV